MSNNLAPSCCCDGESYCACGEDYDGELYLRVTIAGLLSSYTFPGGSPGPYTITGLDGFNGVYLSKFTFSPVNCLDFEIERLEIARDLVNSQHPSKNFSNMTVDYETGNTTIYLFFASGNSSTPNSLIVYQPTSCDGPGEAVALFPLPAPVTLNPYVTYPASYNSSVSLVSSYQFDMTYEYVLL
ncbi:hypothetical protein [Allorhodopirellula heiligendammensis]|uniref:Uncharacterized protein n=1 Tax=Allorhodopirellula heiligendammensis TaxID=2714739 RepID=A0A5C6C1H0_9BACT|nr:hypothetical protein [Allorhodopirellula heiligendammensis]TWU17982.1 hypothetical protein Poly21_01350 [Allorhodopirellula heiligendammensis]